MALVSINRKHRKHNRTITGRNKQFAGPLYVAFMERGNASINSELGVSWCSEDVLPTPALSL